MRTIKGSLCLAVLVLTPCFAQTDKPDEKFYRLDFVAKELDGGKVTNSRTYSLLITNQNTSKGGSIRVGSRLPVQVSAIGANIQYYDLGVNIDCRPVREIGSHLALDVSAEISSVAVATDPSLATVSSLPPVVRHNKWSSSALIPVGKPTVIFSSDDPSSKRTMQMEVTATPVKQ